MLDDKINQSLELDVQFAVLSPTQLPDSKEIEVWVAAALKHQEHNNNSETHLTIRVVNEQEGAKLNEEYRGEKGATNVLSFPYEGFDELDIPLLGDIVICNPVIIREAGQQGKAYKAHWCHMVVHGVLHLLGYDHLNEQDALDMESREIKILGDLGFNDPYK
ncbi:Metal-dependent hydrolase YbeY, involved in rRNA and/or ribosome maturation and assembly [hydrothermal vent metagenome]|uniref:Metal-dependent hydrolase YbeY, involved in rRNA and/or ribosome maturation and assembly n=1 Tax=hydrothermal vent metagenome TaxID=652676 RepID=A0A3B0YWB1_9ZZZZ